MASPICLVNNTSTLNGVNVSASSTATIKLADTAGVKSWTISCLNTDELLVAATVSAGLTIDLITKQATFTAPAAGSAMVFQSVVNNGKDANGNVDPSLTTTFGIYVLTATSLRVGAFDEKTEGSAAYGWTVKINAMIRNASLSSGAAGNGILYSGGVYSVKPDTDGSISVSASGVKVGVLATDAQHGSRGNGALHSVATGAANGFMPSAHWSLVNGAVSTATASTLAKRDGSGGAAFVALTCTTITASGLVTVSSFECTGAGLFDTTCQFTGLAQFPGGVVITTPATWGADITETRVVAASPSADPANWKAGTAGTWTNLTVGTDLVIPVNPPHGAVVSSVVIKIQGAGAHGALPATMPVVTLKYYDDSSNLAVAVTNGSATDTSANTTAFQTIHTITANNSGSGINHTVSKTARRYYVALTAEASTNSLVGATYYDVLLTWKRPSGSNIGQD